MVQSNVNYLVPTALKLLKRPDPVQDRREKKIVNLQATCKLSPGGCSEATLLFCI